MPVVLALDIGGTKLAAALVRDAVVVAKAVAPTPASEGPEAVAAAALALVRKLLDQSASRPACLALATAGLVSKGRVRALSRDLMPGWDGFPLAARLEEAIGLPVRALNDAQAAAYGEAAHGAGKESGSVFFLTVSTGIGGGFVNDGALLAGATGLAGHLGHTRGGVLERVSSGTALARRALELGYRQNAREVIESAKAGQDWAVRLVDDAAMALADVLLDVKFLLDPELFVSGGSTGLNPYYLSALQSALQLRDVPSPVRITPALLGADAGLIGAAAWARAH